MIDCRATLCSAVKAITLTIATETKLDVRASLANLSANLIGIIAESHVSKSRTVIRLRTVRVHLVDMNNRYGIGHVDHLITDISYLISELLEAPAKA